MDRADCSVFFCAMKIKDTILNRKNAAENYLRTKRDSWTEYENMFHGYLTDSISQKTKSQMVDPKLPTIALDRSARVMAQLPTGKVKGISKNDSGGEKLMNLVLDKYVIPNANAQFDFLTKLRMMNLYSNIYGNFFALVDWDKKPNGYIGPDLFLIPIRNVFPQVGATSIEDSDYIIIRSWQPLSYFENLKDNKDYKNIGKIVKKLKEMTGGKESRPTYDKTARENTAYADETAAKKAGYFEVLSMYERDKWYDFCVEADEVFREQDNPHENGELPIVNKYSIPLLDDFMGMGDFERGKPMQYGINSLWNLYLDAVKVSIFPPVLIDEDKVSDQSSIKWSAGAKWLMKMNGVNGAQTLNLTPQGTNTFNNAYGAMNASLLNMFGTTDTTTTQEADPGFGKTPQALKMQAMRENARDTVDRFYTERFLTAVMKKFVNLIAKKMTGSVAIRMFDEEMEEIKKSYPEVTEMFDEKTGKLTISKGKFGSTLYDYEIVTGSTFAADKDKQQQGLISIFGILSQGLQVNPQTGDITSPMLEALKKEDKKVMFGELLTRIVSNGGLQDWDKIITDTKDDVDGKLEADRVKFEQAMQQMMAQNPVSQIPPTPDGMPQMGQGMSPQQPPMAQPMQQPMEGGMNV